MPRRARRDRDTLSSAERTRIEAFLDAFADIEKSLKVRLGRKTSDRTAISRLIDQYAKMNYHWVDDADDLRHLSDIRNILTHDRKQIDGYPVAVTALSLKRLRDIEGRLVNPIPVSRNYRRQVMTVTPGDTLAAVLKRAYVKGFSQFPVVDRGRFRAMITENAITRWLGRRVRDGESSAQLDSVRVRDVVREEESDRKRRIYAFKSSDTPVDEVMALFAQQPILEVVLLTATGKSGAAPLEGIVTEWDVSRYASRRK